MDTNKRFNEAELRDVGIAVLRIVVGIVFLAHGSQKLFGMGIPAVAGMFGHMGIPLPTVAAALSIGAEFLGGLFLVLGLFTRFAAGALVINMAVAVRAV